LILPDCLEVSLMLAILPVIVDGSPYISILVVV